MKDLFVSKEMQKFQDSARRQWTNKKLDLDAVMCGWHLDTGYVLHSESKKTTIVLLEKPTPHITKVVRVNMNGKNVETSIDTIARAILSDQVTVYYSK